MNHPTTATAFDQAPPLERQLVEHIVSTSYADLPTEAVEAARRTILWSTTIAIAGSSAPGSDAILEFATESTGVGEATVLGAGTTASADAAAFANACFAKAHEYEDKFWLNRSGGFAMGFAISATAVACAEELGHVDGETLITAVATAVDVQARLLQAVGEGPKILGPTGTGWNSTYLFSNYGALVAAAKIYGLTRDELVDAFGLLHAQACGNFQGQMEGVLGIRLQSGFAVRNGITAARLARKGISGARQFISGTFGLYALHFPEHDLNLDIITSDLGTDYRGARLGFKGYPCGVVAHPVIDAVRALRAQVDVDQVRSVKVFGTMGLQIMSEPTEAKQNPADFIQAQFSVPWVVACAVKDDMLRLRHFEPEALADPRIRELARNVTVDLGRETAGVVVEFTLADGSVVTSDMVFAGLGHPDNPVTQDMMVDIYRECVEYAAVEIPHDRAEKALAGLVEIETVADIGTVFGQLR